MTISNLLSWASIKRKISESEQKMLTNVLSSYDFDGFIFTTRAKVKKSLKQPRCFVLQNGKISKEISGNSKIYGLFCGVGGGKILIFTHTPSK